MFHVIVNASSMVQHVNANVSIKRTEHKKIPKKYGCNRSKCICENSRYLTNIDAVIVFDEIKSVTDNLSTKITNAMPMNHGDKT